MRQPTVKFELVQVRLGRDLATYLTDARDAGRDWRQIATDLTAATGIGVSHETVRTWHQAVAA